MRCARFFLNRNRILSVNNFFTRHLASCFRCQTVVLLGEGGYFVIFFEVFLIIGKKRGETRKCAQQRFLLLSVF